MDRRSAIKWMLTAAASLAVLKRDGRAAEAATPSGKGYGTDPDLLRDYKPGDLWPLTFDEFQRRTAMVAGLVGVGLGAGAAAASTNLVMFSLALVVLGGLLTSTATSLLLLPSLILAFRKDKAPEARA